MTRWSQHATCILFFKSNHNDPVIQDVLLCLESKKKKKSAKAPPFSRWKDKDFTVNCWWCMKLALVTKSCKALLTAMGNERFNHLLLVIHGMRRPLPFDKTLWRPVPHPKASHTWRSAYSDKLSFFESSKFQSLKAKAGKLTKYQVTNYAEVIFSSREVKECSKESSEKKYFTFLTRNCEWCESRLCETRVFAKVFWIVPDLHCKGGKEALWGGI